MVIFNFEEAGDCYRACCHSNITMCTIWYILWGATFLPSFNSIASLLAEVFFCVMQLSLPDRWRHQWLNLHNRKTWIFLKKKDIPKRKTPFYSTLKSLLNERIFKWLIFRVICTLRAKAVLSKTLFKRKVRLHSLHFPQNTLMLTDSRVEFGVLDFVRFAIELML